MSEPREIAARAIYDRRPFYLAESRSPLPNEMISRRFAWDAAPASYQNDCFELADAVLAALDFDLRPAGPWKPLTPKSHPPLHQQVLVKLREGVGTVCDVACFIGKGPDGESRWKLADVLLESRQIKAWAEIFE